MINLALRNVGCVYDKDDKCIGKFIVNSIGFNGRSMPKYFYVVDGNYVNRMWIKRHRHSVGNISNSSNISWGGYYNKPLLYGL